MVLGNTMTTPLPNGNGKNTWNAVVGGLGAVLVIYGIVSSTLAPWKEKVSDNRFRIEKVETWQNDYMRGNIPSSAEKELSAIKIQFVEVETQMRSVREIYLEKCNNLQKEINELKTKK